jgi:serine/threonine protein kinase
LKFLDSRTKARSLISSEIRVLRGLAELRHPNIIQLFGVHASSRYIILAMERADGNLHALRETYKAEAGINVPPEHALEMLDQVAEALDFLVTLQLPGVNIVSRGLQHCDIKPSNILLVGDLVKVADFGLCAVTGSRYGMRGWLGTPPYAAPELYGGQGVPGTDQHALAVTWCELCYGSVVFPKRNFAEVPRGLPIELTALPAREVPVVTRALHPHPSARWPSCKAFIEALRRAQIGSGQVQRPVQPCSV